MTVVLPGMGYRGADYAMDSSLFPGVLVLGKLLESGPAIA